MTQNKSTNIEIGRQTIATEIAGLSQLLELLGQSFDTCVNKILASKGKVVITGVGKSGHVATKIAATLASTGTPAFFVHPTEASHGDLGMIGENDIVIMLSNSGASRELNDIITYCKRFAICLIGMTSIKDSPLGKASDILLLIPQAPEACPLGKAPTTSMITMMALGDAIAITLAENRGLNEDTYKNWHPGGKLGASLVKVEELMHPLKDFPPLKKENTVSDALPVMSTASRGLVFGCVAVVDDENHIIGSFTDGDIRRNISKNLPSLKLADIMNPNPRFIFADDLAASALKIMQDMNIQSLFVTDRGFKPVGIVKLWDLLRAGVA